MNELLKKLNELKQYELEQGSGYGAGGAYMEEVQHRGYNGDYISIEELCAVLGVKITHKGEFVEA